MNILHARPDKDGAFIVGACPPDSAHMPLVTATPSPKSLPFVDAAILQGMENQLGDPAVARTFVHDFVGAWDDRSERLSDAIEELDRAAALDVVLSIKITSLMLGAALLAELASAMEGLIRQSEMNAATAKMPHLLLCGNQTVELLRNQYL